MPAATAYLLTDRLSHMIPLSVLIGAAAALAGYQAAMRLDASIAGAMATMVGIVFVTVLVLAPKRGLVATMARRRHQKLDFAQTMLTIHLLNHERTPEAQSENRVKGLENHLRWDAGFTNRIITLARRRGLVEVTEGVLILTRAGRERAESAIMQYTPS